MAFFSISKILPHQFYVDKKGESENGYAMIIGREIMVQIGLMEDFKRQVLQWDVYAIPMKEPSGMQKKHI